jgi:hypothetical protein
MINVSQWDWPQFVLLLLMFFSLFTSCCLHGKPKGNYSAPVALLVFSIIVLVLYAGGFWS